MRKIGILNVQHVDNYGAVLLSYALQESIIKLCNDADEIFVIDYRPKYEKQSLINKIKTKIGNEGFVNGIQNIASKLINGKKERVHSNALKKQNFEDFREKYLLRTKIYESFLDNDEMNFDTYVVGSDVVWKPQRIFSEESRAYFLRFLKDDSSRCISYAASIGTDDENALNRAKPLLKKYLCRFDYVSLREKTSIPYVSNLYEKSVSWCIDPTLLLSREQYLNILPTTKENKSKYIYLYLFEDNEIAYKLVNTLSRKYGLEVICNCKQPEKVENIYGMSVDDGPLEFLKRIQSASYIITDSFHGTVFSAIFEKEFYTVSRGNISIRMKDLLERLELSNRYIDKENKIIEFDEMINYKAVYSIIEEWRAESLEFLSNALDN